MKNQENNINQSEQFSLQFIVNLLIKKQKVIHICLLITIVTVMVVSLLLPKKYESAAKILAEPQKEFTPYSFLSKMFLETHKELIVSDSVIRQTIATLNKRPEITITQDEIAGFLQTIKVTSRAGMGKNQFNGNGIGESDTFFVACRANTPQKASDSVNTLIKNYISAVSRVRIEKAKAAIELLEGSLAETSKSLSEALKNISDFEVKHASLISELWVMDKPSLRPFPELANIKSDYETMRADVSKRKSLISSLEKSLNKDEGEIIIPSDLVNTLSSVPMIKNKIADMKLTLNDSKTLYSEKSREIKNLRINITEGEKTLREELSQLLQSEKNSIAASEKSLEQKRRTLSEYEDKMTSVSLLNKQYALLKIEYDGVAKSMDIQLQKLCEARIAAAEKLSSEAGIVVIDWGYPNTKAVSPNYFKNFIYSILIGLLIGILLVLFEYFYKPRPEDASVRR